MLSCKKYYVGILKILLLTSASLFAQDEENIEEELVIHKEAFSTKGVYLSSGLMLTEVVSYHTDSVDYINNQNAYFFQSQFEFKHNISVNAVFTKSPIYNSYFGQNISLTTYELNGHFPCYRANKKRGIYLESGFSQKTIKAHLSEFDIYQIKSIPEQRFINFINAIGFEYKFKWCQLATMTRVNMPIRKKFRPYDDLWTLGSIDWVILVKIKLPNFYKKTNDRYHWI